MNDKDRRRFLSKIYKTESCWLWNGGTAKGYGVFNLNGKTTLAHRLSYLIHIGDPGILYILHECDRPRCVNPGHLWLGTAKDNAEDRVSKGRQQSLLTIQAVLDIKRRLLVGDEPQKIADDHLISRACVYDIKWERNWKHITLGETNGNQSI